MKVVCTRLPPSPAGDRLETSPWISVGREYYVTSVLARPDGEVRIQAILDDRRSLGWFDSMYFMTVDGNVPDEWSAQIREGGVLELAPRSWLATGFWEAYYDGDPASIDAVEEELRHVR